jgi:hypothetical protein
MTLRRSIAALAAVSLLGGGACSTTQAIQRPELLPPEKGIVQAKSIVESFAGKEVEVALARPDQPKSHASVRTGRLASFDSRSFFLFQDSQPPTHIRFEDTRSFTRIDRSKGAGYGFLGGAALGGLVGAMAGVSLSRIGCDSDVYPPRCPSALEPALLVGMLGGLLVGALGAGIGAAVGHRTTLTF